MDLAMDYKTRDFFASMEEGHQLGSAGGVADFFLQPLGKSDLDSLLDDIGKDINADDLLKLEPWGKIDGMVGGESSNSSDSSPLHSPFSSNDSSDHSPLSSYCGGEMTAEPSYDFLEGACTSQLPQSSTDFKWDPSDLSLDFGMDTTLIQQSPTAYAQGKTSKIKQEPRTFAKTEHVSRTCSKTGSQTGLNGSQTGLNGSHNGPYSSKRRKCSTSSASSTGSTNATTVNMQPVQLVSPPRPADTGSNPVMLVMPQGHTINAVQLATSSAGYLSGTVPGAVQGTVQLAPSTVQYASAELAPGGAGGYVLAPSQAVQLAMAPAASFQPQTTTVVTYPTIRPRNIEVQSRSQTPLSATTSLPITPGCLRPVKQELVEEHLSEEQSFAVKREQRKIKNREAAQQSRQRRKDYLESLREQLDRVSRENERLKRENSHLKDTNRSLLIENEKLRQGSSPASSCNDQPQPPKRKAFLRTGVSQKAAAVCVLALMFLVTVNLGPFIKFSPDGLLQSHSSDNYQVNNPAEHFQSRSLMAYRGEDDAALSDSAKSNWSGDARPATRQKRAVDANFTNVTSSTECLRRYFNHTESMRLSKELTNWAERHEFFRATAADWPKTKEATPTNAKQQLQAKRRRSVRQLHESVDSKKNQQVLSPKIDLPPPPRLPEFIGPVRMWDTVDRPNRGRGSAAPRDYSVEVYSSTWFDQRYRELIEAIQRRDDTFYLVSFRRDYLLLPATVRNSTAGRPRMSLVVPAFPLNETMLKEVPRHHVPMMEIECEVTATGLVHIPESLVTPPRRPTSQTPTKSTPKFNPASTVSNATKS